MQLSLEQMQKLAASLREQWSKGGDPEAFALWRELRLEITKARGNVRSDRQNTYRVVFRHSTVVEETMVYAGSMVEAALEAEQIRDDRWEDWSVYSITLR